MMEQATKTGLLMPCMSFALVAIFLCSSTAAQDQPSALPSGLGLSAKYAGDVGIDTDPHVVLTENFEASTFEQLAEKWEDVSHSEIMSLLPDVPPGSGGKQSLQMNHVGGSEEGGHLYRRLAKGYDKLHF